MSAEHEVQDCDRSYWSSTHTTEIGEIIPSALLPRSPQPVFEIQVVKARPLYATKSSTCRGEGEGEGEGPVG